MRGRLLLVSVAGLSIAALPGCTKVRAATPAPPALHVPEAPARINVPVDPVPLPPPEPTPTATVEKPAPPVATGNTTRPRPTPTPTTPPPGQPPTSDQPPPAPVRIGQPDAEKRAQDRLAVAEREIKRVSRDALPKDARDQHDSATRFIRMAKNAMTAKNYVFAYYCADKAATLAELLVRRTGAEAVERSPAPAYR